MLHFSTSFQTPLLTQYVAFGNYWKAAVVISTVSGFVSVMFSLALTLNLLVKF